MFTVAAGPVASRHSHAATAEFDQLRVHNGASWGAVSLVNEPGPIRRFDHFTPAVAAYGGVVHVTYSTRRPDGERRVETRYVVSADTGTTFSRERKLGRKGDLDFAATADGLLFLGDYMGLAASANAVHAVWCLPLRSATTFHQTTWSAMILR